jgi:protein associated with RNAse G/E
MKPNFPRPKNPFTPATKYRAVKTVVDGITFASKAESERYGVLKLLKRSGQIKDFKMQVRYTFELNNVKICSYVADFVVEYPNGTIMVEDVKGFETKEYKIKKKMMLAFFGINIQEIKQPKNRI